MSTLAVGTIKSVSSAAPVFQNTSGTEKGQLAKLWVNFNGTGTVAINQSYNCSSITDNATGSYSVNWSGATGATGSNHSTAGGGDKGGYNNDERVQVYNSGNNQTGVESWRDTTATDFNPLHCLTFGNGS